MPIQPGCKGLEGGKKYLIAGIGAILARCTDCTGISHPQFDGQGLTVEGSFGQSNAQWTFEPVGEKCAIKSDVGTYAARCMGCYTEASCLNSLFTYVNVTGFGLPPQALFEVESLNSQMYSFRADNGKYIGKSEDCVHGSGKQSIVWVEQTENDNFWRVMPA